MGWTDERRALVFRRWKEGASASNIARELGGGVTRNSVLGIIHRAGKAERPKPSKPPRAVQAAPRAPRPVTLRLAGNTTVFHEPETPRPPREAAPVREEAPGLVTALSLGAYQCKWPIGDPQDPAFTHCGRKAPDGPYCAEHAQIAYQPATKRKTSGNELARSLRRFL